MGIQDSFSITLFYKLTGKGNCCRLTIKNKRLGRDPLDFSVIVVVNKETDRKLSIFHGFYAPIACLAAIQEANQFPYGYWIRPLATVVACKICLLPISVYQKVKN
jgi:hypothetical protein